MIELKWFTACDISLLVWRAACKKSLQGSKKDLSRECGEIKFSNEHEIGAVI